MISFGPIPSGRLPGGLAAPQINLLKRVFVIDTSPLELRSMRELSKESSALTGESSYNGHYRNTWKQ